VLLLLFLSICSYGYDKYGYDKYGYDKSGYDKKSYDKYGEQATSQPPRSLPMQRAS
jgi:hypothetical protein